MDSVCCGTTTTAAVATAAVRVVAPLKVKKASSINAQQCTVTWYTQQLHVRPLFSISRKAAACWNGADSEQFNLNLVPISQFCWYANDQLVQQHNNIIQILEATLSLLFRRKKDGLRLISGPKKHRSWLVCFTWLQYAPVLAQLEQVYLFWAFTPTC